MEAIAVDLANPLVDTMLGATTEPTTRGQGHKVIIVPDDHGVAHHGMDVHGVEEGDLADVDGQLGIVRGLGTKQPGQEALSRGPLGSADPAIAVAEYDSLGGRGDGEIAHVAAGLTTAKYHDRRVLAKLFALLEVLGVQDGGHVFDARYIGDIRLGVDTGAHSNSVTLPFYLLSIRLLVTDDMFAGISSPHACHPGTEVDVRPQLEVRGVLIQVLSVAFGGEEVCVFGQRTEVGERREELGGDELGIFVHVVEEDAADLVVRLEEFNLDRFVQGEVLMS
jgi:hypothetical protein